MTSQAVQSPPVAHRRVLYRVLDSAAWVLATRSVGLALQFVIFVTLARLLTPREFGLYALAVVVVNMTALVGQCCAGTALVRSRQVGDELAAGAFWLVTATGALGTGVVQAIAGGGVEAELAAILSVCSVAVLMQHLAVVPLARLQRSLRFREGSLIELAGQFLGSGVVAIVAAWHGWGVWSLVAGGLVRDAAIAVGAILLSPPARVSRSDWRGAIALLRYGAVLTLARLATSVTQYGPQIIVGRVLGNGALGLFTRAMNLLHRLQLVFVGGLQGVFLAAFAEAAPDRQRLRNGLLQATRVLAVMTLPLMTSVGFAAGDLVVLALGSKWRECGPLVQIACLAFAAGSLATVADALLKAVGRLRVQVALQAGAAGVALAAVAAGATWGLLGAAAGAAIALAASSLATILVAARHAGASTLEYLRAVAPSVAGAALLLLAQIAARAALPAAWQTPWGRLGAFGTVVILAGLIVLTAARSRFAVQRVKELGLLAEWYRGLRLQQSGN